MASCVVADCSRDVYGRQLCKPHYMKEWRAKNRAHFDSYMRRYARQRKYGLTEEKFNALLESQGGVCAICSQEFKGTRDCNVDHNHETGEVRGLLCHDCNTGIGSLGDDCERLSRAIEYLKERDQ